jgi:hypothetical protein
MKPEKLPSFYTSSPVRFSLVFAVRVTAAVLSFACTRLCASSLNSIKHLQKKMWQKEMCTKNAFNKRRSRKVSKNKTKKKELHLLSAYFMAKFLLDQVSGSFGLQLFISNELLNQKTSCQHVLYCSVPFTIAAARAHSAKWLLNFQILSPSLK